MASEPVHFIFPTATWDAHKATVEADAYHETFYPEYTVVTRQDVDADGVLTALRAIPDVIEVAGVDMHTFRDANPSIFPELL